MPTRKASAIWEKGVKDGKGSFKGESGTVNGNYSFGSRFESQPGSNPEELLAAAEAACFSMALALGLEKSGTPAQSVETSAACTVEKSDDGFRITTMSLLVNAKVAGLDDAKFQQIAQATKDGCPVSQALKGNVNITLTAKLV
ncbi:MAG: OsmC family peroxiredoxin [Gemmatimonadota bacterium]|nr:OsmC family peroxiredoxin [Gemmatimonadota bacterium]